MKRASETLCGLFALAALHVVLIGNVRMAVADAPSSTADAEGERFFESQVRPLFSQHCLKCHGQTKQQGGLRLDHRDGLLAGGDSGMVIVPGDAERSRLLTAVRHTDSDLKMPPGKRLSDDEVAILKEWIIRGVPFPERKRPRSASGDSESGKHWSFVPPQWPALPSVKDGAWIQNPIDRFVLAGLESHGQTPNSPADKYSLLRRVTYDLTGLPATADEIESFLADDSPMAYAEAVDRLLASSRHGERWGRHWLDLVRYSDDFEDAWRYRDWVVKSFNNDLRYDDFVKHQIAGDLLPAQTGQTINVDGIVATTMLSIGPWGGIDRKKRMADIVDDQIDTIGRSFLGLTLACARCHDHKFDPLTTADYYALAGIFYSSHVISDAGYLSHGTKRLRIPLVSQDEVERHANQTEQIRELERRQARNVDREYSEFARSLLPKTGEYLIAAVEYSRLANPKPSVADFAATKTLQAFALEQWMTYLDGKRTTTYRLFDHPITDYDGERGVHIWRTSAERPWWGVNTNHYDVPIETFALPARSVCYYPNVQGGAVSWKSPQAGRFQISGRLSDADPMDGVGIAWVIDHVSAGSRRQLSSGAMPTTGSMSLDDGNHPDRLQAIEMQADDRLEFGAWLSKGDAHYDVTAVELTITDLATGMNWNLTNDLMENLLVGNPHPDSIGHADTWSFLDMDGSHRKNRMPTVDRALAAWDQIKANTTSGTDLNPFVEAAKQFQTLIDKASSDSPLIQDLIDTRSPFWVRTRDDAKYLSKDVQASLAGNAAAIQSQKATIIPIAYAHGIQDGGSRFSLFPGIQDARIHERGSYDQLGESVSRRFPAALTKPSAANELTGSGRREFAEWIASSDNPLTARVMVNRIWQNHFGDGIVRTPSNVGEMGELPDDPALLDWLALRFIESGWSIKTLTRLIVLSATYQQSSRPVAGQVVSASAQSRSGRRERRPLEAEALRDSLLAVSGRLDERLGGDAVDAYSRRRMLYQKSARNDNSGFGALFDAADPSIHVEKRTTSTVAPQALDLMNGGLCMDAAAEIARLVKSDTLAGSGNLQSEAISVEQTRDRIHALYRRIFGRDANDRELKLAQEFLLTFAAQPSTSTQTGEALGAWEAYAQALLLSNQFLFVD